jgi:uncharacterized repeat protein (TIGR03803 family)
MRRFLPCISLALTTISLLLMSASAQTGTYKVLHWTNSQGGAPTCYCGVVMELTKSGGVWTTKTLHAFLGGTVDGEDPLGLVQDKAGNLYGVTGSGGPNSFAGILFELSPNADGGWTYNILHSFGLPGDGVSPLGAIAIDQAGNIYGTTQGGGLYDYGTVFKLSSNDGGWTLTNIYNFTLDFGNTQQQDGVAIDGAGILYGVTRYGGEYELGTLRTYAQRRVLESDRVAHLYRRQRRRVSLWTSDHRSIRRCLWYGRLRRDQPIRHGL